MGTHKLNTLADRFAYGRKHARMTFDHIARLATEEGCKATISYLSMIESGRRDRMSADLAIELSRIFGCSVEWLIRGLGEPPSPEDVLRAARRRVFVDLVPGVDNAPEAA